MFYAGQSSKDYYTAKNGKLLYFFISRKETNIHSIRLMWNSIENLCCWYPSDNSDVLLFISTYMWEKVWANCIEVAIFQREFYSPSKV